MSGTIVNTSSTIFADDCGSSVTGLSIEELLLHDKRDDAIFDNELAAVGMRQCVDKAVRQIALFGEGDGRILKPIADNKNTLRVTHSSLRRATWGPICTLATVSTMN